MTLRELNHSIDGQMRLLAAKAMEMAQAHCDISEDGSSSCVSYHGIRPFLYCAGLRSSFKSYAEMFHTPVVSAISGISSTTTPTRVLISGSADFIVPAMVTHALKNLDPNPHIVVLDHCDTPLKMCAAAMKNLSMEWSLVKADILSFAIPECFDLIVSDRFLGFFRGDERVAVIKAWSRQLTVGGKLLISLSIHPEGKPAGGDDDSLLEEIQRGFENHYQGLLHGMNKAEVLEQVSNYTRSRSAYPIKHEQEVIPLLEACGFRIRNQMRFYKKMSSGLAVDPERYMILLDAEKVG